MATCFLAGASAEHLLQQPVCAGRGGAEEQVTNTGTCAYSSLMAMFLCVITINIIIINITIIISFVLPTWKKVTQVSYGHFWCNTGKYTQNTSIIIIIVFVIYYATCVHPDIVVQVDCVKNQKPNYLPQVCSAFLE